MIEFDLYEDVIVDFSTDHTFTRYTKADNSLGREVKTPIVPAQTLFTYVHPATDKELQAIAQEGEHIENVVKIFADVTMDILPDDEVTYQGQQYRILKSNKKIVGNYAKYFAGLVV